MPVLVTVSSALPQHALIVIWVHSLLELPAMPALLPVSPAQSQLPTVPAASLDITYQVTPAILVAITAQFATLLLPVLPAA